MSIYTRQGDAGDTRLGDGSQASKASVRVEAIGELDETAAAIGFARQAVAGNALDDALRFTQHRLFNCSSALADPAHAGEAISMADITAMEGVIDRLFAAAEGRRGFVIASGGEAATRLHLARTVARRAERRLAALARQERVDPMVLAFVNRLSDLLFAAARAAAHADGIAEEPWDPAAPPPVQ